jgi:CRP-like cAMP-binding protein
MTLVANNMSSCIKSEFSAFKFLTDEDIKKISPFFDCMTAEAGTILWNERDPCDYVAFIVSGRVEVKKETEFAGKHVVVGVYSKGANVGALCILDGSLRAVTAVAMDDVALLTITRENFNELVELYPDMGGRLMKGMLLSMSKRLRSSFDRLSKFF